MSDNKFDYEKQIFGQLNNILNGDIARVMAMKNLSPEGKEGCIKFIRQIIEYLKNYDTNIEKINYADELMTNFVDDGR